jgi:uncharacterized protein involved in exopolysaccharide biosynthesis
MEETEKTLGDYLSVLKRRKKQLLGTLVVILIASIGVAFGLPAIYRSTATILIEQQEMPEDLVRSTITSFADQRIQTISQRVMTTANLSEIINQHNLYADVRTKQSMESVIDKMRGDIHLDMVSADVVDPRTHQATKATIAFTLSYESKSPTLAQNVASELVSLFLNENLKTRTAVARETFLFLEGEAKKLSDKVAELESRLAAFKERNAGALPELSQLNRQMLDRTENEFAEVERQMRSLEERRIYLQSELAQVSPHNELFSEEGKRILGPADRLKVLQTEFLSLSAKYGPGHPDVVRMRKEIDALKRETGASNPQGEIQLQLKGLRADLAAAREKYSEEHPDVKKLTRMVANLEGDLRKAPARTAIKATTASDSDNPAYIQLQAQLNAANGELDALKSKAGSLKSKVAAFEEKLIQAPAVEREYLTLARDHENALIKYREITAKQMEAQLSQSLETERKGEKFTLIEPPLLPEEPAKPNRKAILLLGILFSFGGGIGTAALGESLDTTVRGRKGVIELLGVSPLGIIPYINTEDDFQRIRRTKRLFLGSAVGVLILGIVLVHFFIVPLDVLWFSALKKWGG